MKHENNKNNYKAAIGHIEKAVSILRKLQGTVGNKGKYDIAYFEAQLKDILLSDHGECGMIPATKVLF